MRVKQFIRQETVLSVAIFLAVLSAFFVHPDRQYVKYIDFRTLGILFSLMIVMAGIRRQGVFEQLGKIMLSHTGGLLQLVLVLVGLCFFGSMLITNDVALMTFVPFTFVVLGDFSEELGDYLILPVVCMQTIAANLGSMLTPIGNPQNLYLYGKEHMSLLQFAGLMLPYTLVAMVLLIAWAASMCYGKKEKIAATNIEKNEFRRNRKIVIVYVLLFVLCLLSVVHILPYGGVLAVVFVVTIVWDKQTLRDVDYSLLLTFTAFFIFIGNMGRIDAFSDWLEHIISGHETLVAILASQITSNVPAALLLSGFTDEVKALIIGTNLGGLGTLIASMASLISYRQIVKQIPSGKGKYFLMFTASNLIFLVILMGAWVIFQ